MSNKRILIVDDEESILTVLRNSLKKVGPDYQITTVTNGFAALNALLKQEFNLVVTDFNMGDMDGLELTEAVRYAQPDAKIIMITGYGNPLLEAETKRLEVFRYLTKPLEVSAFRQLVQQALGERAASKPKAIWSDRVFKSIDRLLKRLQGEVGARRIFLTDANGHIICKAGDVEAHPIENMTALLGGGIATLVEAGRVIDGNPDTIHLAYREGNQEDLYALNVGGEHLLILLVGRGPYSSRLGSVWYHARLAALELQEVLLKAAQNQSVQTKPTLEKGVQAAFSNELDKLFGSDSDF